MTPDQALNIIRQVKANWVANGQDHDNLEAAINTLVGVVNQNNMLQEKNKQKEPKNEPQPKANQDKAQS